MTGRELIVYILKNNLEDEVVLKDGFFVKTMFIDENEAAAKFGVGVWTVKAWNSIGMLNGIRVGEHLYFPKDVQDPRKGEMTHGR